MLLTGHSPVIDGATLPGIDWLTLLSVDGSNNTVSGFEIKNCNLNSTYLGGYGLQVAGQHNTISKMKVHHTWQNGILINGDYNTVEDSTVWQTVQFNYNGADGGWGSALSAARGSPSSVIPGITSYATLRRNTVFNNWGEGLSCYEADHCTLEDNIVYDNWGINLYLSDSTNSLVQRNMVYISSAPAVTNISDYRGGIGYAQESTTTPIAANNTFINNLAINLKRDKIRARLPYFSIIS